MTTSATQIIDEPIYAGFLKRFGASVLDLIIIAPWTFFIVYINTASRLNCFYTLIPALMFTVFYSIYCVKRWGGTPGKLITKIKIIKADGSTVGWRGAILRQSVNLILSLPLDIAMIMVISGMTDAQFSAMAFQYRAKWIMNNVPFWYKPLNLVLQIWVMSEFIVLLCNKRKRALHDFIAGTVVIKREFEKEARKFH